MAERPGLGTYRARASLYAVNVTPPRPLMNPILAAEAARLPIRHDPGRAVHVFPAATGSYKQRRAGWLTGWQAGRLAGGLGVAVSAQVRQDGWSLDVSSQLCK